MMISLKDAKWLLAFENEGLQITTLILNIDGRRYPKKQGYLVAFKNLVKNRQKTLTGEKTAGKVLKSVEEDFKKMETYLRNDFQRGNQKSVVIFSCSEKGLWQTFAFPIPLRSNLTVHSHPYTRPLTSLLDQYRRYCGVLISRERARIFEVYLGEIEEHLDLFNQLPGNSSGKEYKSVGEYGRSERKIERRGRKSGSGISGGEYGLAEDRIERHTEDHVKKHLKRAAEGTFSFFKEHAFDHLILGGQAEIVSEFEPMLHSYLRSRVIGKINTDPKFSLSQLLEETQTVIRQVEWEEKDRLIREITEAAQSGGLGVLGREKTFDALKQGAVHTLVIQEEFQPSGARCPSCNYLSAVSGTCPRCGGALEPVSDLMEEAVEEAISESAQIYHISGHPILDVRGGIAAKLRFPLSQAAPGRSGEAA